MSSKTISELLKESDKAITDKDITEVGDRLIEFSHWVNIAYKGKVFCPLPREVIQTFWDLRNCLDAYCTEKGLQYTPTPKGFDEIFHHIKIHKGSDELADFVDFLKRVESEYPKATLSITPDRLFELFKEEINNWYRSIWRHGDNSKAIINCTTRSYIEKIIESDKYIEERQKLKRENN